MKRLISTFTLLFLILSSCDSPVNNVDTDTRQSTKTKIGDIPTVVLANIAPAKRDSMRKEVVLRFKAKEGSKWKVSWNKNKATPLAVFAGTTQPIHGSPEKGARAFLAQNRSLFNMHKGLGDLKMKEVQTSSKGLLHVRFQQTYHNIPMKPAIKCIFVLMAVLIWQMDIIIKISRLQRHQAFLRFLQKDPP